MKFKNILLAIGLCSSSLFFSSCEDFLTQSSQSYVTTDTFYESIGDCEEGLTAVYNALRQPNNFIKTDEMLRSDYGIPGNSSSRTGFTSTSHLQTFTNADTSPLNKWAALYKCVLRANLLIEGLDKALDYIDEDDMADWTTIKAEAHFFRGLFYFWLHNSYNNGDVIIFDFVPDDLEEYFQPLSKSEDVLAFYRKDLEYALELSQDGGGLAEQWTEVANIGRVTKYTAYAVLGMSYLYEVNEDNYAENYALAAECFKTIIDSGKYQLTDVANNITTQGEFSSEALLEVSYTIAFNTTDTGDAQLYNTWGMSFGDPGGWSSVTPSLWLKDVYMNEVPDPAREENWLECELDWEGDMYYNQSGNTYIYYKAIDGDELQMQRCSYVYQRTTLTSDPWNADDLKEISYLSPVYIKKEYVYADDLDTVSDTSQTTYTVTNSTASEIPNLWVRKNGEIFEFTREFTRRASYSMAINGDETLDYYGGIPNTTAGFGGDAGYFRKLTNWDIVEEESDMTSNASAINLRVIRYADILLMYAEALIQGGLNDNKDDVYEAIKYINKIRYRSGAVLVGSRVMSYAEYADVATYAGSYNSSSYGGDVTGIAEMDTAEAVMNHLMYVERPAELSLDGNAMRVCDMRRWTKSPAGLFDTKTRFGELSKTLYGKTSLIYLKENTSYTGDSTDTTVPLTATYNWGNWIYYDPTGEDVYTTTGSDYLEAYTNYTEAANAYWQIPSNEEMSNPNLYNY